MMSAGSPRRSRSQTRTTTPGCNTVSPQHVTDPTILDQVSGFINEVATYNVPSDNKDQIQWARFEQLDSDAILDNVTGEKVIPSSLILVLGYTTGVQIWAIPANGEAVELLSWRHGTIRVLRILPTPYLVGRGSSQDEYASKRPLMALCDTTTPGPHHCALSFLSLKTGEQVKVIKFKNPILDVLANRRSVVVTFSERIAVFDAFTLEDRLTVTTCYLSPGIYPNPIALGSRWMAYAENKLITSKRSNGGNEGEAVQSYTATVLHAAKSLGKGLRELGETVASSLTGNPTFKPGTSPGSSQSLANNLSDTLQKGVVTILDIENQILDDKTLQTESVVAHFAAHTEAVVCLSFDPSGLLLLTADKRGHDFYLFRIHPHPGGPSLAAVHHLYILHRGDTTARVQDMCFSPDSRWVAVSTLRGTTHVFPITPYGGNVGVRTHATPHVVNRMSRFHRSAGLAVEGRSNSPVSLLEMPINSNLPYNNPRLPPYPHPTIVHPLEQIRLFAQSVGNIQQRPLTGRPRLNSSSEDNIQVAHRLCCCFAPPRAWFENVTPPHEMPITKQQAKPVESLFVMSCHGTLLQYDLDPHPVPSVPKEKVCDETPIVLTVQAKAQWILQRQLHSCDVPLPVSPQNLNLLPQDVPSYKTTKPSHLDDGWLSQVEILTHAGPHRRLWMGPQFQFKTYSTTNGSAVSLNEVQTVDVGRSKPVNMPVSTTYPILIESGSVSSCEQSPKLLETYQRLTEEMGGTGENQLKEDLADAMLESPGVRESGGRCVIVSMKPHTTCVAKVVNPLGTVVTIHSDEDNEVEAPEDAVIHENCDEALFRPVVTPKPVIYAETRVSQTINRPVVKVSSKFSATVKPKPVENIKNEIENNGKRNKSKLDISSVKILDSDDAINVEHNKDVKNVISSDVELKTKNKNSKNKSENKVDTVPKTDVSVVKSEEQILPKPKTSKRAASVVSKVLESNVKIIDSPLSVMNESIEIITSNTKATDFNVKIIKPTPIVASKKSKTKSRDKSSIMSSDKETSDGEKSNLLTQECLKKSEVNFVDNQPILKTLITTPDLMDSVDTFDFPLKSNKSKKEKFQDEDAFDFPPFSKNEDILKEDKFEDARDTSELLESFTTLKIEKEIKSYKSGKYQGLEPDEIVFSSEEEKATTKKPRKPKAKLGVRLSNKNNKDATEKDNDNCSVEITIAAPKKTKSNVISSIKDEEKTSSIIDLPEIEKVDSFTIEMPKKSYSTVAKQNLFEIDPHEDVCDSNILLPDPVYKPNEKSKKKVEEDFGLLKIDKSSDDEKQENCSSQAETTESDDSTSKVVAMDTEEDSCHLEVAKSTKQASEKTVRCKSKKKKR